MKKKLIIWVILLVIVIAGAKIFLQKQSTLKNQSRKKVTTNKEKIITAKVEPSGNLSYFPENFTVYFSEPIFGTSGVVIEENDIFRFLEIKPKIKLKGRWLNSNTFFVKLLSKPMSDTTYTITVKKIPLKRKTKFKFHPQEFSFTTPELKPVAISTETAKKGILKAKLRFNFKVDLNNIQNLIEIKDKEGNKIQITSIKYLVKNNNPIKDTLVLTGKISSPGIYTLKAFKGITSLEGFKTKKDFKLEFSAGFSSLPIYVKRVKVRDLGDLYSIDFNLITLKNKPVLAKKESLANFVSISPDIEYYVYPTKGHLTITGSFLPGNKYTILLFSGIRGTGGETLKNDFKTTVLIPNHKPKLMFLYKGRYFGTKGEWKFPIVAKRLKEVNLNLYLIPRQNITLWYSYAGGSNWDIDNFGKLVKENYKITIPLHSSGLYFIDLKKLIPNLEKGIYIIKASAYSKETKRYYRDTAKFAVSNISIIAKWNNKKVALWVVNSNNATPVKNAKITVYDYSNIEKGKGETNSNGFAEINLKGKKGSYLITAETGNDWTYLKLRDSKLPTSNFDITGDSPDRNYIPYLYFERDLYRPGETIHFAAVIRKNKTYSPISIPIKIKIINPAGKKIKELNGITDKNGFAEFKLKTSPGAPTGKYRFNLYIADKLVYSGSTFVETFAPERMSLKAKFPEKINLKQPFTIEAEAFYLFGAPASGETLKGSITLKEKNFSPEGYKNYSFGPLPYYYEKSKVEKPIGKTKLDKNGKAKLKVFFKSLPEFYNPVNLKAYLEVSEAGSGRVTKKVFNKVIFPKEYYIGLTCGASKVTSNVPLKIKGVVLNKEGRPINQIKVLKYRVFKVAYNYSYYYYNQFSWRKNSTLIPLTKEREIKPKNGKFEITYTPQTSYDDIVVEVKGDENFSQIFINGWGWYGAEKAETPETLIIQSDKKGYDEGETAKVETSIPFEGKILWTVETDRLIEYKWQTAKGKVSSFNFKVPEGYPCVYVTALLIHTGDNYLVSRAFGVKRIKISPAKLKLKLEMKTPEKIKPGEELTIKLKGNNPFEATISIVDEGILQITNFKTPDPYSGILRPVSLGLESADGFGWLVKKYLATGGGMMSEAGKGFVTPQFTKIVSIWSGKLESDNNGNLKYRVKIPQYNGRLRVMVSAVSENKLGAVSKNITVKSDIIATPTIPRFLTVKDKLKIPVTLINTTDKKIGGKLKAEIKNADISKFNKQFELQAQGKKTIFIPLKAGEEPGTFKINILVFGNGEKQYFESFQIPLLPSTTKATETKSLTVKVNKKNIKPYFENFVSRGYQGEIYISLIPGLNKLYFTKTLLGYPYGCIEQVSTKTLAMIKLQKLLPFIDKEITLEKYKDYVQSGIGKILSMQTFSGGFSYWPGQFQPAKWASIYATLVLIEAKNSGFSVPQSSINAALNYIETLDVIPPLGYYVLSKGERLQKNPAIIQQIEEIAGKEKLTLTPLMWYTAALYNCGKSDIAQTLYLKGLQLQPEQEERLENDFYTPLKGRAIRVFVGEEINYDRNMIENLISKLSEELSKKTSPHYYTTQELAWSMFAIGNFVNKNTIDTSFNATLTIDGKSIKGKFEKGIYKFRAYNLPEKSEIIVACNKTPFFVEIVHSGYKKNGIVKAVSNGLKVKERLLDFKTGKPISKLKQGEVAVLEVTVKSEKNYYPNCAIEIPLAGGLEAENPRLNSRSLPYWAESDNLFDYIDIRDEKIIAFSSVSSDAKKVYLLVRAVTPGEFYLAPAFATVMYKPFVNGQSNPGKVIIETANGF